MANQIKLKRGLQKNLPSNLLEGEVVITTDTNKLYSKNRSTDFSIENNQNDIATHARIFVDGSLSVYPTATTLSGSGSTEVPFFISHIYY